MSTLLTSSLLLASIAKANVVPRAGPVRTLQVPIPTQAEPFTTTVPGCGGTVDPFVIVGVPTGTFSPGTVTIYLPPQADATSTTIFDTSQNATEVVIATPLPGECGEYPFPDPPSSTGTESASPSATPNACPEKGCSEGVIKSAQIVIDAINQVTLLSQNLQSAAKRIGVSSAKRDDIVALGPIDDVARGLLNIVNTLTQASPRFLFLPALPPGCSTDTVVIALIQFVRVHQALLNIIIGQGGLLEGSPVRRDAAFDGVEGAVHVHRRANNAFVGAAIAKALRALEKIVDTVAFKLIDLVPTRSECAKNQKAALDTSLTEAITTYEG